MMFDAIFQEIVQDLEKELKNASLSNSIDNLLTKWECILAIQYSQLESDLITLEILIEIKEERCYRIVEIQYNEEGSLC